MRRATRCCKQVVLHTPGKCVDGRRHQSRAHVTHARSPEGELPLVRERRNKAQQIDPSVSRASRSAEGLVEFGIRPVQLSSSVKLAADILREEIFRIRK